MLRIIKFLIYCVVLAVAAGFIYFYFKSPAKADVETGKARINEIESMVRLCAVDIYSEIPVLDTINDKVIFGIQKQSGSISFDLEKLNADTLGDTVRIILPPEIVELYESTEDNSWEVIDTKNIGLLGVLRSDKLTDREENIVKAEIKKNSIKRLYSTGVVRRARAEGKRNLEELAQNIYRKPVIVTDTAPDGCLKMK